MSSPEPLDQLKPTWCNASLCEENFFKNNPPFKFQIGDHNFFLLILYGIIIALQKFVYWLELFFRWAMWPMGLHAYLSQSLSELFWSKFVSCFSLGHQCYHFDKNFTISLGKSKHHWWKGVHSKKIFFLLNCWIIFYKTYFKRWSDANEKWLPLKNVLN